MASLGKRLAVQLRKSSSDVPVADDGPTVDDAPAAERHPATGGLSERRTGARSAIGRAAWLAAHIPEGVLFVTMTGLTVLVAMQVVLREWIGSALDYYEEAGTVLFAWTSFLGAAVMVKRRGHYSVRLLIQRFSARTQSALRVVEDAIIVAVSGIFLVQAVKVTSLQADEIMPVSGISKAVYSASLPAGTGLMLIYAAVLLVRDMGRYLKGEPPEGEAYHEGVA